MLDQELKGKKKGKWKTSEHIMYKYTPFKLQYKYNDQKTQHCLLPLYLCFSVSSSPPLQLYLNATVLGIN